MKREKLSLGFIITLVSLVSCIILGAVSLSMSFQMKSLLEANKQLSERVAVLSDRLTEMAQKQRSIIKEAVDDAKTIDNAYSQLHALTDELHDTKLMLASAKKMISLYKKSEENAVSSYIMKRYTKVPKRLADDIAKQTLKVAKEENVPVSLLVAIMDKESGFNPMAVSPAGARGLMQVMPFWVKEFDFIKDKRELHDTYKGIKAGALVLRYALDRAHGNVKKALAIYKGPKYVAYVKHVLRLAGEFEVYKSRMMQPAKNVLETFYVPHEEKLISMNGFGAAGFDSLSGYPTSVGFSSMGPLTGSGFTAFIG